MNWWNSADSVSFAGTIAQVVVTLAGVVALTLGIRTSQLQDRHKKETELNIALAKKEAAKANERAASLENETARARLELERLKQDQEPWKLSDEVKSKFIDWAGKVPKGKIEVSYLISDGARVSGMARFLEGVFRTSGFTMAPEVGLFSNPSNPKGIGVAFIREEDKERANAYANIFKALDIPCEVIKRDVSSNPQDVRFLDPVTIRVYSKP